MTAPPTAKSTLNGISRFVQTTAFRLSLIYITFFCLTAFIAGSYVYWDTNVLLTRQLDQTIGAEMRGLAEQYRSGGISRLSAVIAERSQTPGNSLYFVADRRGRRIAGNLRQISAALAASEGRVEFSYQRPLGGRVEQRAAYASVVRLPGGYTLIVGRDIEDQQKFGKRLRTALAWGLGFIIFGGLAGAWLVSRNVLRRIDAVTRTTRSIMAGDMSERLAISGSGDELDRLSESVNEMLNRIEHLMAGLQEVSHNIAHDLRTPLNRLRNRVEAALHARDGEGAYRAALEKTIEEADELIKTFNALLSIARLEAGAAEKDMALLDLAEVVRDVAELYEPVAEEQGVRLRISGLDRLPVKGDRHLLGQAVANLIDNALKYGVPQEALVSTVTAAGPGEAASRGEAEEARTAQDVVIEVLACRREADAGKNAPAEAQIIVADNGPGIPPERRAQALQRFARLDASRSRPGSGLGLSLVSAVAVRHGGRVELQDNGPGLRVVISLPLAT